MRKVILHGHVYKNAGTTFDWSLARNFGEGFVEHRDDQAMRQRGAAYLADYLEERPHISALSSHHLCCPLPDANNISLIPVFLLRHPIERIWSVYHFDCQHVVDTPGAIQARRLGLKGYVLWRMRKDVNPTIRNFQTRYCSNIHARDRNPESSAHLEQAKRHLTERSCFGLVERYDESMVLLERELNERGIPTSLEYRPQNVSGAAVGLSRQDKLDAVREALGSAIALVEDRNALDLELYEYARARFSEKLVATIFNPAAVLHDFRQRCTALIDHSEAVV